LDDEKAKKIIERKFESSPNKARIVQDIMDLLHSYEPYFESGFVRELFDGGDTKFQQRYWEMVLGLHLSKLSKLSSKPNPDGPDFQLSLAGRTVQVEAVAPERTKEINAWYASECANGGNWFDATPFHLRWTQAISSKSEKFRNYLLQNIISPTDVCVIAVNSGLLGSLGFCGHSDYPAVVDVVFAAGPEYCTLDAATLKPLESGYRHDPDIEKHSDCLVPKRFFTSAEHSHISAIVASSVTPPVRDAGLVCVHNPYATNPLPLGSIGAIWEYHTEYEASSNSHVVKLIRYG
jgi:hypothetical protein